jgi:molybdopterin molybdotransferase
VLTLAEARDRIVGAARVTAVEEVPLGEALGRVLATAEVVAGVDVPPFANSSMDGFAVRAADGPGIRRLTGEVRAGAASLPTVEAGTTVRIMTGAPLPPGADAVVPLEDAEESEASVRVPSVAPGAHVRPAGLDTPAGTRVELPLEPLTPAGVAVLASLGHGTVQMRRRPVVGLLSTGDELVAPGASLGQGQIYDANTVALAAAVREAGGEPRVLARAPDDASRIERQVAEGAAGGDLLVVSGGVSVGRHDHVRGVLERLGRLDLWRIAVQPGKPLAFGSIGDTPVLGLPGNPVSALVTFELFGRPLIRAMLGLTGDGRARVPARMRDTVPKDPAREAYLRVIVSATPHGFEAQAAGGQDSSQLRPLASANALLVVPVGQEATRPGASYDAILLGAVR